MPHLLNIHGTILNESLDDKAEATSTAQDRNSHTNSSRARKRLSYMEAKQYDIQTVPEGYASAEQVKVYCKRLDGGHCWSCRFFDMSEELTVEHTTLNGEVVGTHFQLNGYCRCHSPQHGIEENGDATALWPWVQGHDWCGEYKAEALSDAIERITR